MATSHLPTTSVDEMKSVIISRSPSGSFSDPIHVKSSPPAKLADFAPWLEEEKSLTPAQKAAILIQYARDGQELDVSKLTTRSRLCHRLRKKYQYVFRTAAWAMLLVQIFERPVWTFSTTGGSWQDGTIYPSYQLTYLPFAASTVLIAACLAVLWVAVLLEFGYKKSTKSYYLTLTFALVLLVKSVTVLAYIVSMCVNRDPIASTSPIEVLCILLVEYRYESNIGYLLRTVPKFTLLMMVLASIICTYASLGFLIFNPQSLEAKEWFPYYGSAIWNMLMVLNGSNWPTPMMPAFEANRLYCIYFFLYIIAVQWGFLNLILGFIYLFFKLEQRQISRELELTRAMLYENAFTILDIEEKGFLNYQQVDALLEELFVFYEDSITLLPTAEERYELILILDQYSNGIVDEDDFRNIDEKCFGNSLKVLRGNKVKFNRYLNASTIGGGGGGGGQRASMVNPIGNTESFYGQVTSPFMSRQNTLLPRVNSIIPRMSSLQGTGGGNISDLDAVNNRDLLFMRAVSEASVYGGISNAQLIDRFKALETMQQLKEKVSWQDKLRGVVVSYKSYVAMLIDSVTFDIAIDSILFVLGVVFLVAYGRRTSEALFMTYLSVAALELLAKWCVKGAFRCYKSKRVAVDFIITLLLCVILTVHYGKHLKCAYHSDFGAKACILLRLFLWPRNIIVTDYFRSFRERHRLAFDHAFKGANHFTFLLLVMFAFMYAFAAVGMQAFGGNIMKSGKFGGQLQASIYGEAGYWPLNFNDLPSGFATMFVLLHVNNMHVTAAGLVTTNGKWAQLFFAAWYCIGVLFLLNVLTAVFLNEFMGYLETLAAERRKAAAMAAVTDLLTSQADKLPQSRFHHINPDSSMGSHLSSSRSDGGDSYVGISAINKSLLLQLERDQRKATNQDVYNEDSLNQKTFLGRLFHWTNTPAKSAKSDSVGGSSRQNVSALLSSSQDSHNDSYVSSINNSQHFASSYNRPIQKIQRPIQPTMEELRLQETINDRASRFSNSIFESSSGRKRLETWISRYYPKNIGFGKNIRRGSGKTSPRNVLTENLIKDAEVEGKADDGGPTAHARSSFVLPRRTSENPSNNSSSSTAESALTTPSPPPPPPPPQSAFTSPPMLPSNRIRLGTSVSEDLSQPTAAAKRRSRPRSPHQSPVLGGSGRKQPALSLFQAARQSQEGDGGQSDDSSDSDCDNDIVVDIAVEGNEFANREDSMSVMSGSLSASNTKDLLSAVANDDDTAALETNVNTEYNARQLSTNIQREMNVLKHLSAHHIAPRRTKSSILHWMYGANELSNHEKAAVFIQFARDGEEHSIFSSERALLCYRYRSQFSQVLRLASFLYAIIRFFERPVWTYYHSNWDDDSVYPMSGLPLVSANVAIAIKLPLLLVMLGGFCLEVGYKESDIAGIWTNLTPMRVFRYLLTLYCVAQVMMLLASIDAVGSAQSVVTLTSAGSMLYVLWFNRRSLAKFRMVLRILPRLSTTLFLFFVVVLIFAAFGPYIFRDENTKDDDANAEYFGTFGDSTWSVFVAITSSDYPNQIMPAYAKAREVFLYFFAFICVGAFGFLNLIIIIVLVQFQKAFQLHNDYQKASRQILLLRAFEILDKDGKGYLEKSDVKLLLDELYKHYSDFKKAGIPQQSARRILIDILDVDGDGKISVDDFLLFLDVTRIKLSVESKKTFMEIYLPSITHSAPFKALAACVAWRFYDLTVDCLGVVLIVASLLANRDNVYQANGNTRVLAPIIVAVFVFEAVSKLLVRGWAAYVRSFRNKIDLWTTVPMLWMLIADAIYTRSASSTNGFYVCLRVLQAIRVVIFPRNIRYFLAPKGISRLVRLLKRVFAKIFTLSLVFLCCGYIFANVGSFAYGGLIDRSPTSSNYQTLLASPFGQNGFWALNFNDFMSACITLFTCLHVSDFDVVTSGFTATTNDWSRLYFAAWYLWGVLLMLNIIKSFFLGEFLGLFAGAKESLADDGKAPEAATDVEQPGKSNSNRQLKRRLLNRLHKMPEASNSKGVESPRTVPAGGKSFNPLLDGSPEMLKYGATADTSTTGVINGASVVKDRTYSNMSASSATSAQSNRLSLSLVGRPTTDNIELQPTPVASTQSYYQASSDVPTDGKTGQDENNLSFEEPDVRYYASTSNMKNIDGKDKSALISRLKDLTVGVAESVE